MCEFKNMTSFLRKTKSIFSVKRFFLGLVALAVISAAGYQFYVENFTIQKYINYSDEECIKDERCVWLAFKEIALGREFVPNEISKGGFIFKWSIMKIPEIVIAIRPEEMIDKFKGMLQYHLDYIEKDTGLKFSLHQGKDDKRLINNIIFFSDDFDFLIFRKYRKTFRQLSQTGYKDPNHFHNYFRKYHQGVECFALGGYGEKDQDSKDFVFAMQFIKSDMDTIHISHCTAEEFIQSLGLPNDIPGFKATIFNDESRNRDNITKLDHLLLQILYDDRIKFGMREKDIQPIFHDIYQDKLQNFN